MGYKKVLGALTLLVMSGCTKDAPADVWSENAPSGGRILIAGDSTAADYPVTRKPQIGWGQVLDYYLNNDVEVLNRAVNGRSTKSYIEEGKWEALVAEIASGDLVLISFGHNDSRDDAPERYAPADGSFRENMARFASDVTEAGGYPVILSSAARRLWEGPAMVETHGAYRLNAGLAAADSGARYIDLSQLSMDYFETLGRVETKDDYFWMTPEDLAEQLPSFLERYPEGIEDNTHFREVGACGVARIIAQELSGYTSYVDETRFEANPVDEAGRPADVIKCAAEAWN